MKLYSAATILALVSLTEAEKTRNLKSKSSKSTKSWSFPKTKSCKGGSTSSSTAADTGYTFLKAGSLIDTGDNICAGSKVELPNILCEIQEIINEIEMKNVNPGFALGTAEQAGGNVTLAVLTLLLNQSSVHIPKKECVPSMSIGMRVPNIFLRVNTIMMERDLVYW